MWNLLLQVNNSGKVIFRRIQANNFLNAADAAAKIAQEENAEVLQLSWHV